MLKIEVKAKNNLTFFSLNNIKNPKQALVSPRPTKVNPNLVENSIFKITNFMGTLITQIISQLKSTTKLRYQE